MSAKNRHSASDRAAAKNPAKIRDQDTARPPTSLLATAIQLGAAGFRVFPLHLKDGEICRPNAWPDRATTDAQQIVDLWQGRDVVAIAIATGDDFTVIDIDEKNGKSGSASLNAASIKLPKTLTITTASGGRHYVYRTDASQRKTCSDVAGPNGDKLQGVDVRGAGGFIKAHDPEALIAADRRIADVPDWLPLAAERMPRGDARKCGFYDDLKQRDRANWGKKAKPSKAARKAVKRWRKVSPKIGHSELLALSANLAELVTAGHRGAAWAAGEARRIYIDGAPDGRGEWAKAFDEALLGSTKLRLPLRALPLPKRAISVTEVVSLTEADALASRWFGDEYDLDAFHVVLATAAVEKLDGDPVWTLLVSGSGNAKTETVSALTRAGAHIVSTISSAGALLSGTSGRERSETATGGLLAEIGPRGIIIIKDVTSLISLGREARAEVFAALREIFDGKWSRAVGTDGGRRLDWAGRLIVIGAVTSAWDRLQADTIAQFGDRFVLVRMDSSTGRLAAGRQAIANTGKEAQMRAELADVAAGVLAGARTEVDDPDEETTRRILAAADLVTLARTAVDLDYRGNVVDSHMPEMGTRFGKQLAQIWRGAVAVGLDRSKALDLAIRCARDSMPPLRLEVLEDVAAHPWTPLREVVKRTQKPRATIDRQLQALHLLGLLVVDEELATAHTGRETTTWRYTLAEGIDIGAIAGRAVR